MSKGQSPRKYSTSKWDQNYTEINWKKKKEFIKKYRTMLDKGRYLISKLNSKNKTSSE